MALATKPPNLSSTVYDSDLDLGYCSLWRRAHGHNLFKRKNLNLSFITKAWGNWRHAIGQNNDLINHEGSKTHTIAINSLTSFEKPYVVEMLDSQVSVERKIHTLRLHSICLTIEWLAKHGLALRGHRVESSNFQSLLELLSKFDTYLNTWSKRKKCYISSKIQDEIRMLMINQREVKQELSRMVSWKKWKNSISSIS